MLGATTFMGYEISQELISQLIHAGEIVLFAGLVIVAVALFIKSL